MFSFTIPLRCSLSTSHILLSDLNDTWKDNGISFFPVPSPLSISFIAWPPMILQYNYKPREVDILYSQGRQVTTESESNFTPWKILTVPDQGCGKVRQNTMEKSIFTEFTPAIHQCMIIHLQESLQNKTRGVPVQGHAFKKVTLSKTCPCNRQHCSRAASIQLHLPGGIW